MRFLLRFSGLFFAAAAFVAVVADAARSIANSEIDVTAIVTVLQDQAAAGLESTRVWFENTFSQTLWTNVVERLLAMPFSLALAVIAAICFFFGQPPRSAIGYRT